MCPVDCQVYPCQVVLHRYLFVECFDHLASPFIKTLAIGNRGISPPSSDPAARREVLFIHQKFSDSLTHSLARSIRAKFLRSLSAKTCGFFQCRFYLRFSAKLVAVSAAVAADTNAAAAVMAREHCCGLPQSEQGRRRRRGM